MTRSIKVFLASSSELKADRDAFEIFINRRNKAWHARGVFLELIVWEDFLDAVSRTRLQDEYNETIRGCDIFAMLFATKVGKYTEEEFEAAFGQFTATGKPFIFTYFRDTPLTTGSANRADLLSLIGFQEKLKALGHYWTVYENVEGLQLHFGGQLDKLADSGFIRFEPGDDGDAPRGSTYEAQLTGDGAIAQGDGAQAAGRDAVIVKGNISGTINTGTQTTTNTGGGAYVGGRIDTGGGAFVGRDAIVTGGDFVGRDKITTGLAATNMEVLFAPLVAAVGAQGPLESPVHSEAVQQVQELKSEVAKGKAADDTKVGRIINGLIDLVPSAVGSVVSIFASPLLGGIAGPVTKGILDRLNQR